MKREEDPNAQGADVGQGDMAGSRPHGQVVVSQFGAPRGEILNAIPGESGLSLSSRNDCRVLVRRQGRERHSHFIVTKHSPRPEDVSVLCLAQAAAFPAVTD